MSALRSALAAIRNHCTYEDWQAAEEIADAALAAHEAQAAALREALIECQHATRITDEDEMQKARDLADAALATDAGQQYAAQAADMREALELLAERQREDGPCWCPTEQEHWEGRQDRHCFVARAALASGAGARLLERLRQVEEDNRVVDDDCMQYARKLEKRVEGDRNEIDQLRADLNAYALARDAAVARAEEAEVNLRSWQDIAAENAHEYRAAVARVEKAERTAERRKRHIGLCVERLRNAGQRIREIEADLPHWANVPNLRDAIARAEAAEAVLRRVEWVDDQCPTCRGWKPHLVDSGIVFVGHAPDCALQAACRPVSK